MQKAFKTNFFLAQYQRSQLWGNLNRSLATDFHFEIFSSSNTAFSMKSF